MLGANQGFSVTEAAIETTSMVTDDVQAYPEGQHLDNCGERAWTRIFLIH